jgi:nitrite reductase/ring-hydroxylating ferredoxin subunit
VAEPIRVAQADELPPGRVVGAGPWAVGNADGTYFAVSRRCRHLRGCLVCPWHRARYAVATGQMVKGPQGAFAKVPGLDASYRLLTRVAPLKTGTVINQDGTLYVR